MVNKPTKINLKSYEHIKSKRGKNHAGKRRVLTDIVAGFITKMWKVSISFIKILIIN